MLPLGDIPVQKLSDKIIAKKKFQVVSLAIYIILSHNPLVQNQSCTYCKSLGSILTPVSVIHNHILYHFDSRRIGRSVPSANTFVFNTCFQVDKIIAVVHFWFLTLVSASSTTLNFNIQQLNCATGPVSWGMNHYVYETTAHLCDDESSVIPSLEPHQSVLVRDQT